MLYRHVTLFLVCIATSLASCEDDAESATSDSTASTVEKKDSSLIDSADTIETRTPDKGIPVHGLEHIVVDHYDWTSQSMEVSSHGVDITDSSGLVERLMGERTDYGGYKISSYYPVTDTTTGLIVQNSGGVVYPFETTFVLMDNESGKVIDRALVAFSTMGDIIVQARSNITTDPHTGQLSLSRTRTSRWADAPNDTPPDVDEEVEIKLVNNRLMIGKVPASANDQVRIKFERADAIKTALKEQFPDLDRFDTLCDRSHAVDPSKFIPKKEGEVEGQITFGHYSGCTEGDTLFTCYYSGFCTLDGDLFLEQFWTGKHFRVNDQFKGGMSKEAVKKQLGDPITQNDELLIYCIYDEVKNYDSNPEREWYSPRFVMQFDNNELTGIYILHRLIC